MSISQAYAISERHIVFLAVDRQPREENKTKAIYMNIDSGKIAHEIEVCRGHRQDNYDAVPLINNELVLICNQPRCKNWAKLRKLSFMNG